MKILLQKILASRETPAVLVLLALTCLAHIPWLFTMGTFTSGDWAFIGNQKLLDFVNMSPLWVIDNLGDTSATPHFYFIRFLEGLFVAIGGNFALTEKIFYLIPMSLGASIFSYIFLRQYFRPSLAVIGAIVYCFNTSYIFNHAGPLNIGTVYALAPLGLWLFMRIVTTERKVRAAVIASIVFSIMIYYELRITLIVGFIAGLWLLYRWIMTEQKRRFIKQLIVPLFLLGVLVALLNLFWLIPYVISSKEVTFSNLLERQLLVSFSDITNAMTLHHPFWTGERPATFVEQPIPLYAWLIPATAFFGLILPNRKKLHIDILFWTIVGLVGILLIKQVNEPFVNFYPWIFEKIPGFAAFRESSKFYLLVILAYAVLIPATLSQAREYLINTRAKIRVTGSPKTWKPIAYYGIVASVACVFLINIVPLITGSFRTMYIAREMPTDYVKLDTFLNDQQDYFRTLWFPTSSRWSTHTNAHPVVNAIGLDRDIWSRSLTTTDITNATLRDKTTKLLSSDSSNDLVDTMSVKYVIVPLRDTQSEDDFIKNYGNDREYYTRTLDAVPYLKKINIGTSDLAVYENKDYKPYVSTHSKLQQTSSVTKGRSYEDIHSFTAKTLDQPFNHTLQNDRTHTLPSTTIEPLLTQPSVNKQATMKNLKQPSLYENTSQSDISYTIKDNILTFSKHSPGTLHINDKSYSSSTDATLESYTLDASDEYLLEFNNHTYDLVTHEGKRNLGTIDASGVKIYKKSAEVPIKNASFQDGPWHATVEDCNDYDNNADIKMDITKEHRRDDDHTLALGSGNHTACTTSPQITPTKKGDYLLSFDYRSEVSNKVGYEIVFKDPSQKPIKKDIPVTSRDWTEYNEIVSIPADSSVLSVRLFGYSDYRHQRYAITQYDELSLTQLQKEGELNTSDSDTFTKTPIPANDSYSISYVQPNISKQNVITNSSFESGLWQNKVFDCNNYDNFADIGMNSSSDASDGKKSLELTARTHVACTSKSNIPVNEGTSYTLSLDYQSPNAKTGGYTISFNDPLSSKQEKILPIKNGEWATQIDNIDIPYGATEATVTFYAYGSDLGRLKLINRYDNVSLTPSVNLQNKYYLVDAPAASPESAPDVTYTSQNNTFKKIEVKNAQDGFYLQLNESFNPLWKLYPEQRQSLVERILPLSAHSSSAITHMQINGQNNGWYVDTKAFCAESSACHKNTDGSYDISFIAEFSPQRYFYLGSIVSIITCIGIATYLIIRKR